MPEYAVTLRYTLSWIGNLTIKAKDEEAAQAKVEKLFPKVVNFPSFETLAEDGVEQDEENLEVEQIEEV
jgi:hypothetical protein